MTTKELLALVADWRRAAHQLRGDSEPMPASAMRLDECADELEAALSVSQGQGWLPIESAPMDGSEVLLSDGQYVTAGFWHDGSECYGHRGGAGFFAEDDRGSLLTASNFHATHWQPLPAAPAQPDGVE